MAHHGHKAVLIIGGFGYLGLRIASALDNCGFKVFIASRKNKLAPAFLKNTQTIKTNYKELEELQKLLPKIDFIIHAGGPNSSEAAKNPAESLQFNCEFTWRLLDIVSSLQDKKHRKFIYLSSAHVYKAPLNGKLNEKSCAVNSHPYAVAHLCAEKAVLNYSLKESSYVSGLVLRLSNAVGAPVDNSCNCWSLLINDIVKQYFKSKSIKIFSNPNIQRNFFPISSLERFLIEIISSKKNIKSFDLFNFGGDKQYTLAEISSIVVDKIEKLFGERVKIQYLSKDKSQPEYLDFSIQKLKSTHNLFQEELNQEIDSLISFCEKQTSL